VLKDSSGAPENGKFSMEFSIYNDSTGGDLLWNETQDSVEVKNGLFNVMLGTVDSIPDSAFKGPDRWLQVKVNDSVLSPRRRIVSVGYAFTDGDWTVDGDNIYREQGNVGIGTTNPVAKIEIVEDIAHYGKAIRITNTNPIANNGYALEVIHDGIRRIGVYPDAIAQFDQNGEMAFYIGGNYYRTFFRDDVGIGTWTPQYKLDVEGYVQAYGYYTGDIVFQKDKQKLWRMFEDEEGLYLENLKTGKVYRFILQEVEKK
jgi:hypothetical protein